uniref:GIN domain-containing protein n=1 Tax=Gelidibacter sp. TaxID=2018083 RepID=UPI0040498C2A
MKQLILTFLIALAFVSQGTAQDDGKIKGDRNVTIKQTDVEPFNRIIVGEEFTVEIVYNSKASVEVEADDNLHDYIKFNVNDGVLTFQTTLKITSSKKMAIKVNYTEGLQHIETLDNAEIRSLTTLELKNATLKTTGSSKAYLNIRTDTFDFTNNEKAKVKLNVSAESIVAILGENSKTDATFNTKALKVDMYQRANANVDGVAENSIIRIDNSSTFNGKTFTTKTCELITDLSSSASLGVTDTIAIEASGSSEIYLYNTPKIALNKFMGTAKLQKKEN